MLAVERRLNWDRIPNGEAPWDVEAECEKEASMSRTKQRRKQSVKSRRESPALRDARIMEEIKNRRYLAFVRAIVNGVAARGAL